MGEPTLQARDYRWHRSDPTSEMHQRLLRYAKHCEDEQSARFDAYRLYAAMYSDTPFTSLTRAEYSRAESPWKRDRLTLNLVKACVSTVHSKITQSRPKPTVVPNGADFEIRIKAPLLDQFLEGLFFQDGVYQTTDLTVLDSEIYGSGFLYGYIDRLSNRICHDRVYPWEILVGDDDAYYGTPRSMLRQRYFDPYVLAEYYPRKKRQILDAKREDARDRVRVTEGWHLKSGPDADDGKYAAVIDGVTLEDEPYDWHRFPFPHLRWTDAPVGFYGDGITKDIFGVQLNINRTLRDITRGHHLIGKAHWMVHSAAGIPSSHISNDMSHIVRWSGTIPPQVYVPQAIAPEIYTFLQYQWAKGFELVGLSQMDAAGTKPAGINSGIAMREYHNIGSQRYLTFGHRYEQLMVEIAELDLRLARELKHYKVRGRSNMEFFDEIDWKDIDLDADAYYLQVFASSELSVHPAARREEVQEMLNAGLIDPDEGLDLLNIPDTRSFAKMRNAPMRVTQKILDMIVRTGEYEPPDPNMDLKLTRRIAVYYYLEKKVDGNIPLDRLLLLQQFLSEVKQMMKELEMAATAPTGAGALPGASVPPMPPELATASSIPVAPPVAA